MQYLCGSIYVIINCLILVAGKRLEYYNHSFNDNILTPNLFFVGVSKCGTTSMARILTQHPLIVAVGNKDGGIAGESHIYDKIYDIDKAHAEQLARLRTHLQTRSPDHVNNITENGIIMHYTPHYAGVEEIEDKILDSIKRNGGKHRRVKYLLMIRNPASRVISSWWYKSGCYKRDCPKPPTLQPHLDEGFAKADKLNGCFAKLGLNMSFLVDAVRRGAGHVSPGLRKKLDMCPINKLQTAVASSMYSAHVGKSMYAYQLLHWMASIRKSQIYVMVLDNFVADPLRELQLFFNFLKVPLYGEYGYKGPDRLLKIATEKHNVHPVPAKLYKEEVAPRLEGLAAAFEPSIQQLCVLLSEKDEGEYAAKSCTGDWKRLAQMMKAQHEMRYGWNMSKPQLAGPNST